jgi:hypothetical protein
MNLPFLPQTADFSTGHFIYCNHSNMPAIFDKPMACNLTMKKRGPADPDFASGFRQATTTAIVSETWQDKGTLPRFADLPARRFSRP